MKKEEEILEEIKKEGYYYYYPIQGWSEELDKALRKLEKADIIRDCTSDENAEKGEFIFVLKEKKKCGI